jgi:hypothetical protein
MIKEITKAKSQANYGPIITGGVMFSLSDIENAKNILGH